MLQEKKNLYQKFTITDISPAKAGIRRFTQGEERQEDEFDLYAVIKLLNCPWSF